MHRPTQGDASVPALLRVHPRSDLEQHAGQQGRRKRPHPSSAPPPPLQWFWRTNLGYAQFSILYQPLPFTAFLPTWINSPQTRSSRKGARSPLKVAFPWIPPMGVARSCRRE